jgi:preprotein translocase subunit SecE
VAKKVDEIMADEDNSETPSEPRAERSAGKSERRERPSQASHGSFFSRTGQFLRDVRAELKRVSWPSPNVVKNTTLITLVAVIFFAVYLFAVDQLWAFLLTQLNHLLNSLTGA